MPNFCVMASTRAWLLSLLVSTVASLGCSAGSDTDSPDRPPSDATGAGGDSGGGDAGGGGGGGAGGANGCEAAFGAGVGEGTAADDEALDVAVDASGNVYVTGYEGGLTGVTNVQPTGDARAFVAKYSASGELQWRTELDTPGTDTGEGIAIDPMSGDVYVAGRTTGVLAGTTNQGKFDLFLAVLSAQGEIRAVHQTGRERPEHPVRLGLVEHRVRGGHQLRRRLHVLLQMPFDEVARLARAVGEGSHPVPLRKAAGHGESHLPPRRVIFYAHRMLSRMIQPRDQPGPAARVPLSHSAAISGREPVPALCGG